MQIACHVVCICVLKQAQLNRKQYYKNHEINYKFLPRPQIVKCCCMLKGKTGETKIFSEKVNKFLLIFNDQHEIVYLAS